MRKTSTEKKFEKTVIEEGKRAFRNDIAPSDNPYISTNERYASLWESGWCEAETARVNFIKKMPKILEETNRIKNRNDRMIRMQDGLTTILDPAEAFFKKAISILIKAVLIIAVLCLAIFGVYNIFKAVGSWPSWAIVIVVLLLMILYKK